MWTDFVITYSLMTQTVSGRLFQAPILTKSAPAAKDHLSLRQSDPTQRSERLACCEGNTRTFPVVCVDTFMRVES